MTGPSGAAPRPLPPAPPVAGLHGGGAAAPTPPPPPLPVRLDGGAVAVFLVVAFGAAWLIALPLWLSGRGLDAPGATLLLLAMMTAPSIATAVVELGLRRRRPGTALRTGIRAPGGIRSWWRWGLVAWLSVVAVGLLVVPLSGAAGTLTTDLTGFSGLREVLREQGVGDLPMPITVLVALQVVQAVLLGWVNVVPALGEEWGWRGWLLPELLPLGRWRAIGVVGVVWGLWHAPVVLLGYNYPGHAPALSLLLMVVFCVVVGGLLGWLRLVSGSVWPAAIGHGFVNAIAGLPILVAAAGVPIDNARTGLLGWPGWVLTALALAVLVLVHRRRTPRSAPTDQR